MPRALSFLAALVALAAAFYQFYLKEMLLILGYNRVVESIGNRNCQKIPDLKACEKIVLHQSSGRLYLACSEPQRRTKWLPSVLHLDTAGASEDYLAVYDPETSKITKLMFSDWDDRRGFSSHGMDVIPSATDPSELFVYLVNHRPPADGVNARLKGADSVLHIFRHRLGSDKLTHIKTFKSPLIISPNDVVGSNDGKSLYFTNDHGQKTGIARWVGAHLRWKSTSVVYCHIEEGCKYAAQNMFSNNGIVRASNGTFYVSNIEAGRVAVLEEQSDNTLVLIDYIQTDRAMDNLAIDSEGHVWAAAFPNFSKVVDEHFKDPKILAPSCALRFSMNTDPNASYGGKYKVNKLFEDDGNVASGITSAVYDAQRGRLFLHGILASHLTICKL